MAVRFGVYVNNRAAVFLKDEYPLSELLRVAVRAEELGFDFVSVGDSVLAKPRYSPIPVLAAIAARTSRVGLATGILQPHLRNPVLVAQEWTTLDVISDGRTIMAAGLGTGDRTKVQRELDLVGIPMAKRGRAFDESIALIRRLWTEEHVSFAGEVFRCDDITLEYLPVQQPHPPVVVAAGTYTPRDPSGGRTDNYSARTSGRFHGPFERVARLGDGWITSKATPAEFAENLALIRTLARERYHRTLGPGFAATANCWIIVGDDIPAARREGIEVMTRYHGFPPDPEVVERWLIHGPPERCAEQLRAYVAAGANAFQFVIAGRDQEAQMERLSTQVVPLVQA